MNEPQKLPPYWYSAIGLFVGPLIGAVAVTVVLGFSLLYWIILATCIVVTEILTAYFYRENAKAVQPDGMDDRNRGRF